MKNNKVKKYNITSGELENVLDELDNEIKNEISQMTPEQRKKDKDESKKWVIKTKKRKKSVSVIAKKIK